MPACAAGCPAASSRRLRGRAHRDGRRCCCSSWRRLRVAARSPRSSTRSIASTWRRRAPPGSISIDCCGSAVRPLRGAQASGLGLSRPLLDRTVDRALKALNLVLQAGGFGVVAIDLADVPLVALKRIPFTTWLRVQRTIEGSDTACVLVAPEPLARSAGGVTLSLGRRGTVGGRRRSQPPPRRPRDDGAGRLAAAARGGGRAIRGDGCRNEPQRHRDTEDLMLRITLEVSVSLCALWFVIVKRNAVMFGALYAAEGTPIGRAGRRRARVLAAHRGVRPARDPARSERSRAPVRRRADDSGGAAADRCRSRAAACAWRSPARARRRGCSSTIAPGVTVVDARARSGGARAAADCAAHGRRDTRPRLRTTRTISFAHCATGACGRWASSPRYRRTTWPRGWAGKGWRGSGSRAARIRARCCRRCRRSGSSRRSISSGRSTGLEPLAFVLGRLMEPLSAHLERRDRGAAVLHVRLHLVTRTVHERSLRVASADPRRADAAHAGAARPRIAPAFCGHRSRGRGRRSDPRPRCPVFVADASAAVAGAAVDADGAPDCAHGRRPLRLAGGRGFVAAGAFAMKTLRAA